MVALFRIESLSSGRILIDDIDISTMPLCALRSKLCIIPQDPVMFSASVRFNLDPFDEFSDAEVWEVLNSVNMLDHVQSLPNKLQEQVAEGGDNFSAGQRQVSVNYVIHTENTFNVCCCYHQLSLSALRELFFASQRSWYWMKPLHPLTQRPMLSFKR
jgi:ABC-type transport system involved in Fe-S cluster assembly fused permease/ATPase subunit